MFRKALLGVVLCAIVLSTVPVFADLDFGQSARASAMGGAGLAVLDQPSATSSINPAALALVSRRTRFIFPSVGIRTQGTSVKKLVDNWDDITDSSLTSAISLAREFGSKPTFLSLEAHSGIEASAISVDAGVEALGGVFPNAAFATWVTNGTIPATPSDAKAQIAGSYLTLLPSFASGWKIPQVAGGKFYVGSRMRLIHSIHYTQNLQLEVPAGSALANIVADGALTRTEDNGFAMDLGMAYKLDGTHETTYGFACNNLVHNKLSGVAQERLLSVGVSTRPISRVLVAADVVNIWKAFDEPTRLRVGAELQVAKRLALRAGYSGDAFTYGIGAFGYNFAFSEKAPFTISQTLAF